MLKRLALSAALVLGTASLALAHGPGGHGPGGHPGPHPGGPGHVGVPGHFGGPAHFGVRAGGGRFWHGIWYPWGVGPCWSLLPNGAYVWICN